MKSKEKGFTLIELLVVISIIGLLASVILVSLNGARVKARDAKRAADLKQLITALELYFDTNNSYPSTSGNLVDDCSDYGINGVQTALSGLVSGGFLSKIPKDPDNRWPYCYFYQKPASYVQCPNASQHPYLIIYTTEQSTYANYALYGIQGEAGSKARYCIYPP